MPTISGFLVWMLPQTDGTILVREGFNDEQGGVYPSIDYEAPVEYDINSRLSNDIAALQAQVGG